MLREALEIGSLGYKLSLGARRRKMSEVEYLAKLLDEDLDYTSLEAFSLEHSGKYKTRSIDELADEIGVSRATVLKWRGGFVLKCSNGVSLTIQRLYGIKVPSV